MKVQYAICNLIAFSFFTTLSGGVMTAKFKVRYLDLTGRWVGFLSIGSATGVAVMGQARGKHTFFGHLKWIPAIAAGYIASILVHMAVNSQYFAEH